MKELSMAETDDKVDNHRSRHTFMEYDTKNPACYFYLLSQCIKKALFVAIALLMYNIYCYSLFLSAFIQYISLMYYSYARPFKSAVHNVIIIFEEAMTLFCFILLFRYANEDSVISLETSQAYAKLFALCVFILTIVPAGLALFEFTLGLRNLRGVCNWTRDYKEEKESFDSSEEEIKNDSDLLKNNSDDSLVEKEITLSSEEEKQEDTPEETESEEEQEEESKEEEPEKKEETKEEIPPPEESRVQTE